MNPDVGQLLCPDLATLAGESDRPITQRWLRATSQPDSFSSIPIPLSNPLGGLWRSVARNIVYVIRGFVGPGEPVLQKRA